MRKKKTAVWFYLEIDVIDDVDAQQYHRASFSTRNSALNTSLRKPIRMEDFIQLCDSIRHPCLGDVTGRYIPSLVSISVPFSMIFSGLTETELRAVEFFNWRFNPCFMHELETL